LSTQREQVARSVQAVEERGITRMVALAASGDDSAGLFASEDREAVWLRRWSGLAAWFIGGPGAPSGADDLEAATTKAIRELLSLLRRVVESSRRPITRASELVHMARWFRRLESEEAAAELFDAAFGLGRPLHLRGVPADIEPPPPSASWRSTRPVPVPVTLREHGRRPSPGRPAPAADFTKTKAELAAAHAADQQARARAALQLTARPIEGRTLSEPEVVVLFELLDRAAHRREVGAIEADRTLVVIEGAAATLVPDAAGMVIRTHRGTMTIEGHRLEVTRSERRT
jgi:uncharacterized protein (TIGR02677 family)